MIGRLRSFPVCLVVDDEPLLANFMASVATEAGWIAMVADTAQKFEECLDGLHPDVIVLDLAMPDRDGVELIRHLAQVSYAGNLIIVSGCDHSVLQATMSLAALHGLHASACARKPVAASDFVELLDRAKP